MNIGNAKERIEFMNNINYDTDGKLRTSKVKVLEEIPLEECGVYGKILAKKHRNAEGK